MPTAFLSYFLQHNPWTVLSLPPEAMRLPSGDQATAKTVLVCPC
jgi:hypothetical protein